MEDSVIEKFCNQVSGNTIVPADELLYNFSQSENLIIPDAEVNRLSKLFKVSNEVVLLRFVELGKTTRGYYLDKKDDFEKRYELSKRKKEGFAPYYKLVMGRNGDSFLRLVFDAYHQEKINERDVSNFIGAKFSNFEKIENDLV